MLWSIRSNFAKSTKRMRIKLFELSAALKTSWVNLTSACVADLPVVQPNWLEPKCASKCSLNHRATNFSAILAIVFVIAIGLMSCSTVFGGCCFGNGVILATFQQSGITPCRNEEYCSACCCHRSTVLLSNEVKVTRYIT